MTDWSEPTKELFRETDLDGWRRRCLGARNGENPKPTTECPNGFDMTVDRFGAVVRCSQRAARLAEIAMNLREMQSFVVDALHIEDIQQSLPEHVFEQFSIGARKDKKLNNAINASGEQAEKAKNIFDAAWKEAVDERRREGGVCLKHLTFIDWLTGGLDLDPETVAQANQEEENDGEYSVPIVRLFGTALRLKAKQPKHLAAVRRFWKFVKAHEQDNVPLAGRSLEQFADDLKTLQVMVSLKILSANGPAEDFCDRWEQRRRKWKQPESRRFTDLLDDFGLKTAACLTSRTARPPRTPEDTGSTRVAQ